MKLKVLNNSKYPLPARQTEHAAAMDLRANIDQPITLKPLGRALIPTGLHVALPPGYELQIRARSGLALKYGLGVLNAPGTIDPDYRGDIGVIIINFSNQDFTINDGDRIAQVVVAKYERVEWEVTEDLGATRRGSGGFGHTGR